MHASRLAGIFVECYGEGPSRPVMTLGGTSDPCASVELYNISDGAKTKEDAVAIANFLENKLSIPQSKYL